MAKDKAAEKFTPVPKPGGAQPGEAGAKKARKKYVPKIKPFTKGSAMYKAVAAATAFSFGKKTADEVNVILEESCVKASETGKALDFNTRLQKEVASIVGAEQVQLSEGGIPFIKGGKKPKATYVAKGEKKGGAGGDVLQKYGLTRNNHTDLLN